MDNITHSHNKSAYSLSDFYPLITIFCIILLITGISQFYYGWDLKEAMRIFMGLFFLVFGGFKLLKLHQFAQAYTIYDLIAKKYKIYAYIYPFIELSLGIFYLMNWFPKATNIFTLIIMVISAAGVFNELRKGHTVMCACLGTVFKIPMTYVTLAEDLLMALMALIMLF